MVLVRVVDPIVAPVPQEGGGGVAPPRAAAQRHLGAPFDGFARRVARDLRFARRI